MFNILLLIVAKGLLLFFVMKKVTLGEDIEYIKGNITGTLDPVVVSSLCIVSMISQFFILYYVMVFFRLLLNSRRWLHTYYSL